VGGAPESSADGQQGLRLHAGIAVVASLLSAVVTVVFAWLGSWPLAVVFAVVTLAAVGALVWALRHRRRGARLREFRARLPRP
jgi:Flp pilus assembly protein TadB